MSSKKNEYSVFPFNRAGGILLHPTSLPGDLGIGDLGKNAFLFIDFLKKSKLHVWQILPLGPTGYGNSPYQCFSAFAGNPFLISIDKMNEKYGFTFNNEIPEVLDSTKIDYGKVITFKMAYFKNFYKNNFIKLQITNDKSYLEFKKKNSFWLDDFAIFMTLKEKNDNKSWIHWDTEFKLYDLNKLKEWEKNNSGKIEFHKFVQFLFFDQWNQLKNYARLNEITILGDLPIYVALDSADVWSNQSLFYLEDGNPKVVAGVPPDYFSKTGQLWGNPIYNWEIMKKNKFKWWIKRIKHTLKLVDLIRLDHFRGFEAYWEVPGKDTTAANGKWIKAPGLALLNSLKSHISPLPIIAEDLGVITKEVIELRNKFSLPGMRILQFAFGEHLFVEKRFLPHNYDKNTVVYTGTHDNETLCGWWNSRNEETKISVLSYLNSSDETVITDFIRIAWSSVARLAVIPMQDLLRKDNESRMNLPGTTSNNWEWRFLWEDIKEEYTQELVKFTQLYER